VPARDVRRRRGRLSNLTHAVPRHFVGKERVEELQQELQRYAGRIATIAITGMRGCGKSTLALAYADEYQRQYRVRWWLRAADAQDLETDLAALAIALEWVQPDEREDVPIAAIVHRLEEQGERTLLIYDNAIDADVLKRYLPKSGAAHVLITSTAPAWGAIAERITLRLCRKTWARSSCSPVPAWTADTTTLKGSQRRATVCHSPSRSLPRTASV
jgi:energy-coupling factor transporter ATP-binding protein EcfA2